jgi:hypothetical protein
VSFTLRAKRVLIGAAAGAMVLGLLPAGAASAGTAEVCAGATDAGFSDVTATGTHSANINCMAAYGVGQGRADGSFGVFANLTRGQAASLFVAFARAATNDGILASIDSTVAVPFTDIATNTHRANIEALYRLGLISGTSATTYSPNASITRAQFATILRNAHAALGVTFPANPTNPFTDIAGSVHRNNIVDLHAVGVISGLTPTTYGPSQNVARGQTMSLLALSAGVLDDLNIWAAPRLGVAAAVSVLPANSTTQTPGTARQYTATLRNADGTLYVGPVFIRLRDAAADGSLASPAAPAAGVALQAVSDGGVVAVDGLSATIAFAGIDGQVSFLVRHTTPNTAADAIPQVFRGADATGTVLGSGGAVFFSAAPIAEATATQTGAVTVTRTNKAASEFIGDLAGVTVRYVWDSGDIFLPAGQADFVARLSVGDTVTVGPYAPTTAPGQSTFNLTNDVTVALAVTSPTAVQTVDANTATISGTGNPGWQVVAYRDTADNNTYEPAIDPAVTSAVTIGADGSWSLTVPLVQGTIADPAFNDFLVVQRVAGAALNAAPASATDVVAIPRITESPAAAFALSTVAGTNVSVDGTLAPSDVLTLTFSADVTVAANASVTLRDLDGTVVTLTRGTNMTCTVAGAVATCTVTGIPVPSTVGQIAGLQSPAQVDAASGWTATVGGQAAGLAGPVIVTGF